MMFFDIHNDVGYLSLAWSLEAASNGAPVSCEASSSSGAAITASAVTDNALFDKDLECVDGNGFSDALLAGDYVVSVAATTSTGDAVGVSAAQTKMVDGENRVTNLGTVV